MSSKATSTTSEQTPQVAPEKIDRHTLNKIYLRAIHLNALNDYPAQMHSGYTYALIPAIEKIYKDDKAKRVDAYKRHMTEYFNVTPYISGIPMGATIALEEQNARSDDFDTSAITGVKTSLMGPLSAIGDTLFHATLRVIATAAVVGLATSGNFLAPILFLLIFNIPQFIARRWSLNVGYGMGADLLERAESSGIMEKVSYAASAVGLAAIGAMTAFNVSISTPLSIPNAAGGDPTTIQSLLDTIMPKMLPLILVLFCYWLIKKKHVNIVPLLLLLLAAGVILSVLGIIA
jgi:fructoselysine and glucoselysine-specific PTS system IID component